MTYHTPVLLNESVDGLEINPEGIYVDATFGGGGHSRGIIQRLKTGRLIAFDQDEDAERNVIKDERFLFINQNFRYLRNNLRYHGIQFIDGLLADLGVSSHHLDVPERGFSFSHRGELDMRMNRGASLTARKVLNSYGEEELQRIFSFYGEIRNSKKLANLIIHVRREKEIREIPQFVELIAPCIPVKHESKYLAKVFQALRIEVNRELDCLNELLMQCVDLIKKNGRLVMITYHSLEDRMVKNFIRSGNVNGLLNKDFYGNIEVPFAPVNKKVIVPGATEIRRNSRARSAKLRIALKVR
jgi:16S rRNA (cytosine1402-N4)-methyltransferase